MPLVKEGRLTALMAVHHKEPHAWSDDELAVIREVTDRSWAHIERVRDEAAREEAPSACGWPRPPAGWAPSTTTC